MIKFFDTNVLLKIDLDSIAEKFAISSITLTELENLKDTPKRAAAQKVSRWLATHEDNYEVVRFDLSLLEPLQCFNLELNNDIKIISCALAYEEPVEFVTEDLCCLNFARLILSDATLYVEQKDSYTGYKEVVLTETELAHFYEHVEENPFGVLTNEYLHLVDEDGGLYESFKWTGAKFQNIHFPVFESRMFGRVKPRDKNQLIAMDSLKTNQLTMLRGPAGSGKSYLACGFLLQQLEKGVIDKIVVLVNTPAAKGACKLGFYPGTKDEKLLSSTAGNILSTKLGSIEAVEMMIDQGRLELLPMADIRGVDFSGTPVGVWILEAQNTSPYLIQLCLQRVGDDSIVIIDGDDRTQIDIAEFSGDNNGMRRVSEVFRGDSLYGEVTLTDIHRSKLAAKAQELC